MPRLEAPNANISDLTGLEGATNLTELYLGPEWVEGTGWVNSNAISDLSLLLGLTNLIRLDLRWQQHRRRLTSCGFNQSDMAPSGVQLDIGHLTGSRD